MKGVLLKRALVAGAAALVLTGGAISLMPGATATPYAEAADPGGPGIQAFIDLVARKLGITSEKLSTAMTEARKELGIPERGHGPGMGDRRMGPPVDLSVAAQAIGITPEQLRQELPGKSLAQVAQAHSKTAGDVATALKNADNKRVDEAVAAGKLTAEQAAHRKQQVAQRIEELVNHVMPQHGAGPGPRCGEHGPRPNAPGSSSGSGSHGGGA